MPYLRYCRIRRFALSLLFVIVVTSGCARKETVEIDKAKNEEILARIGEDIITINDYKEEFAMLPSSYRDVAYQNKRNFLDNLINKRLLLQEAKRKHFENSESVRKLFQKVKEEIIIQELIDREISDNLEVTDSEIEKYYNENQNNYMEGAKIRASHILVDSEVLAKKIQSDLKQGYDFAELAKECSLDIPTKERGGDIGYFTKGALLAEFEDACDKVDVGGISDVVKTALGYHIIKVSDKKAPKLKSLEEVREDIKSELLLDKEIETYNILLQKLREKQKIVINNELLESVDFGQIK